MTRFNRAYFYTKDGVEYLRRLNGPDIRIGSTYPDIETGLAALKQAAEQ